MFFGEGGFGEVDNSLVHMVLTCMHGAGVAAGWEPRCWVGSGCAGGRCGGHGCGRNTGSCGSWGGTGRKTGWHIWLSAQSTGIVVDVVEMVGMPVEIMMASISFIVQSFKLFDVFCFYFLVSVLFDFVDKQSGSV